MKVTKIGPNGNCWLGSHAKATHWVDSGLALYGMCAEHTDNTMKTMGANWLVFLIKVMPDDSEASTWD